MNFIEKYFARILKKTFGLEVSGNIRDVLGGFYSSNYKYNFSYNEFVRLVQETYNRNSDLQDLLETLIVNCLELPYAIKKMDGSMTYNLPEKLMMWMNEPSPNQNWSKFLQASLLQYLLAGEIFYLKDEGSMKVFLIQPDECFNIKYSSGMPYEYTISESFFKKMGLDAYELKVPHSKKSWSGRVKKGADEEITSVSLSRDGITREKYISGTRIFRSFYESGKLKNYVSHFYNHNPVYHKRGLSIIVTLMDSVEILSKGRKWNRSILENEGRPSGVLFYPPKTDGAERGSVGFIGKEKINQKIASQHAGFKNAGKMLVLEGGLQFKEVQMKLTDVDFTDGMKLSRENIANRYRIPLDLAGSSDKSTFDNKKQSKFHFYEQTCKPLMNMYLMFLSKHVLAPCGLINEGETLCVDPNRSSVANELILEQMEKTDKLAFLTINEKRMRFGFNELDSPNADEVLVSSNLKLLNEVGIPEVEGEDESENESEPPVESEDE